MFIFLFLIFCFERNIGDKSTKRTRRSARFTLIAIYRLTGSDLSRYCKFGASMQFEQFQHA